MVYGRHDCVQMVAAMRAEMGAPVEIPPYQTETGGLRALRRKGWQDLPAAAAAMLGPELETPLFAREGDVLLFPADGPWGGGLGLVLSHHRILVPAAPPGGEGQFVVLGHVDPDTGKSLCSRGWRLLPCPN